MLLAAFVAASELRFAHRMHFQAGGLCCAWEMAPSKGSWVRWKIETPS